jgi:tetratricopeptide (TPR) repeat protein
VNLARVYQKEGRISEALTALEKAAAHEKPAAPWVINWLTGQINERNAYFDEAITSYESVLATRIPARGFDFSLDYEVINALGRVLFNRAMTESADSPARVDFLTKSIATYRRTIAIDSENVEAHHGLHLAYSNLSSEESAPVAETTSPVTPELLTKLASEAIDPKRSEGDRAATARSLRRSIQRFMEGPRPEYDSVLEPLYLIVEKLGPAWESASSPLEKNALGRTLELTHSDLHKRLKPDETAEGRAISIARKNSPAADQNAQSIVIHPLHRPGAPGIDPKTKVVEGKGPAVPSIHPRGSDE